MGVSNGILFEVELSNKDHAAAGFDFWGLVHSKSMGDSAERA